MNQKRKKQIAILLVCCMLFTLLPSTVLAEAQTTSQTTATEKNITLGTTALKGGQLSNVYFGNYQQTSAGNTQPTGIENVDWIKKRKAINSKGPYYNIDPIKWRVLSNSNGKTFLLSDQNLDMMRYHASQTNVTWEKSEIRSWLNGDEFYNFAFSTDEKNAIAKTNVVNEDNEQYNIDGGENTEDYIFLLSIADVRNAEYGFTYDKHRYCYNTEYNIGGGKYEKQRYTTATGKDYWWLRSPGMYKYFAAYVNANGSVDTAGQSVYDRTGMNTTGVRPVLNLNSSNVLFTSAAVGGKSTVIGTLYANSDYEGNEYKLTMLDGDRNFTVSDTSAKSVKAGENISLEYTGAKTGDNEYVSAMIVNDNNEVLYYGQLTKATSANDEVALTIPLDIDYETYKLLIFNEQINGDYKTDYSSDFETLTLSVKGTLTASDFTCTLPTDLTYDGNAKAVTVTSAKDGMGAITVKYYDENGNPLDEAPINVGIYSVKIDVAEGDNYFAATDLTNADWKYAIAKSDSETQVTTSSAITYGDNLILTATVSKNARARTTTPDMVDFYVVKDGNEIPLGTGEVTYNNANKDSGTAKLTINTIEKALAIGENTIIVDYGGSINLNGSESDTITVTLNPKEVGLMWSGHENLVYDGKAKNVTASAIRFIDGDNVSITVTGGDETNAGTYTATATLTGADKAYYKLPTNNTIEYTITKKSSGSAVATYTVKFDTDGGNTIKNQTVTEYQKAKEPTAPTKDGYTFAGWYSDKALTKAYDFTAKVTKNMTLYAKWIADEEVTDDDNTEIWNNPFTDVSESDWFYNAVKYAYQNKLFAGMSTTEFAPNMPMSRGMLVTVLYRMAGSPAVEGDMPFVDVNSDAYYHNAILWAVQNNIVSGIADDLFAPDANITREQIAIILYRFAQYCGYDTSVGEDTNILSYDDFTDINEYAITAMQYAAGSGFLNGRTENTLNPQNTATRAEVAAILQRFIEGNR